ncbi:speckle-type POZ protein-like [Leptopilina boulardi]|uniref:speckle-type POZ protein-like n=1 Tax=Leptopilina boulardi TaxID=63433 RepID=UPI0021F5BB60|nr:speckle-type POZ protein-like [Leptopilina boulardi]
MMSQEMNNISMSEKVDDEQSFTTKLKINNFKLTWTIENFEFICKYVKIIESPRFPSKDVKNVQWFLQLEPTELKEDSKELFKVRLIVTDDYQRHVNVKITFFNLTEAVAKLVTHYYKQNLTRYWTIKASDLYNALGKNIPNSIQVTCELNVFDSGMSIVENKLSSNFSNSNNLVNNINTLYRDEDFKDVIFRIGRKIFTAHKAILAFRSPTFKLMFKNRNKRFEKFSAIINITDVTPIIFEKLLCFIYTDSVEKLNENPLQLYIAAEKYQLKKLQSMCIDSLIKNLTTETILITLKFANLKSIYKLKNKCLERLNTDLNIIKNTNEFTELIKEFPNLIQLIDKMPDFEKNNNYDDDDYDNNCRQKLCLTFRE